MGIETFRVIFDKPDKVYHPEEMVTGRVALVLDSEMEIEVVKLIIKGKAKFDWMSGQLFKSSEIYIKSEQILIGGKGEFELPKGKHTYPFSVKLPSKAPSSFNHLNGKISYYGKAKIDLPLNLNKKERTEFTVISNPLNLNLFPNLRIPVKIEKSTSFCCMCCCFYGQLNVAVRLPKTGFGISESIPITLEVDNASTITIKTVYVYLRRIIHWTADHPINPAKKHQKDEIMKLALLNLGGVLEGQSHTWVEYFTIPPISFPNLDGCSIIKIDHELQIKAEPLAGHCSLYVQIPITIGDIPLSEDPNDPIVTPQLEGLQTT